MDKSAVGKGAVAGFWRRLFGGGRLPRPSPRRDHFFLDVECDRCGERFHLSINRSTDCLQIFDEPGVAWRLRREVVGARCRAIIQVRLDFSTAGQIVHREIAHGRFLPIEQDPPGSP